jgi:hypothetical protein
MPKVAIAPRIVSYGVAREVITEVSTECPLDHTPNAETIAAIQESHNRHVSLCE